MNIFKYSTIFATVTLLTVAILMQSDLTTSAGLPRGAFSRFISVLGVSTELQARAVIEAWLPLVEDQGALLEETDDDVPATKMKLINKIDWLGLTTSDAFKSEKDDLEDYYSRMEFSRFKSVLGMSTELQARAVIEAWLPLVEDQAALLEATDHDVPTTKLKLMNKIEELGLTTSDAFDIAKSNLEDYYKYYSYYY